LELSISPPLVIGWLLACVGFAIGLLTLVLISVFLKKIEKPLDKSEKV
jgi:hypothetical protein